MPSNQSTSVEYLNIINAICPLPLLPLPLLLPCPTEMQLKEMQFSVPPIKLFYIMQLRACLCSVRGSGVKSLSLALDVIFACQERDHNITSSFGPGIFTS